MGVSNNNNVMGHRELKVAATMPTTRCKEAIKEQ
jgi:hypothetical protein|tara:strand:+ start:347 stop:448 length:102 start_codon:yes stop_codon:yes gene_type:complete